MDYTKKPGQKIETIGKVLNNEKSTISVITPFYNGGKTLMETANALFSQTYPYFEWIIVDDGSKDEESLKKLAELEKMDKRIHVYHKENGGPSIARDYAIEKSSKETKYLYFLDCDDIPSKTMIECLYWTLETHPDCSFAYTTMVNFGDREFLWEQYLTVEREMTENVICVSSLVKKEDVLEVGGFGIKEKSMYEDWNLWLKLLQHGKKPIRVNAPLFWYRVSGTGEFSRANKNKEQAMRYVNETASKIEREVEIVQFPREGGQFDRVEQYENMVVPQYEKDKKTKILYLFPWMVVGGADLFNLDLLKRIDKNKYSSIVVTALPGSTDIRQEFEEHADYVYDMSTFLERKAYINFVDYLIESRKVDVVVVSNTQYGYYMIPYLKGKYPNIAFIDYIHSIDLQDPREGFGKCTIDVNKYLTNTYVCNNFTKNQLKERYNKTKVETLYIGTDTKRFDPKKFNKKELKQKYGIPEGRKVITFIARLSVEKRPEMFVKIAKKLLEKHSDLYFVIAGSGDLYHKISKKITDDFKMLGMVKETEEVYAISDITINCSSLEGLALTSYESLAMNVPVISSDVGGQTELIDEKVGGIVHYNDNCSKEVFEKEINEYVKETERVLNNLDSIKKNCRKKIESGFTVDLMIEKYEKIIDESIKKEKDKKTYELTYMVYDLALEIFHTPYYLYCKHYYKTHFGMEYSNNKKPLLEGKAFRKKFKRDTSFRKHYVVGEVNTILDCGRALKRTLKEGKIFAKFAIKSIPASIKFVIKMIIK